MRTRYLVTYDVCHPTRLRKVFEICKSFGDHLQLSVFRCDLSKADLIRMKSALKDVLHMREDQVLFVDVGPPGGRAGEAFEAMGLPLEPPSTGAKIV